MNEEQRTRSDSESTGGFSPPPTGRLNDIAEFAYSCFTVLITPYNDEGAVEGTAMAPCCCCCCLRTLSAISEYYSLSSFFLSSKASRLLSSTFLVASSPLFAFCCCYWGVLKWCVFAEDVVLLR